MSKNSLMEFLSLTAALFAVNIRLAPIPETSGSPRPAPSPVTKA